ncbi:hypothetical protein OIU85_000850 [Salix viminalis]|uniref:DEX1 C-terminal domain-containing protein n=1 Tax=Salix viminalis TaxID=40686 RepID=A0A9Q0ZXJ6_SALVM|nr:hypothetical protein OIU85_000850 [Salix viminalis]
MKPPAIRVFLICFLLFTSSIHGEDSNKSKFRDREATDDALGYPDIDEDALLNTQCPRNLELRWQTEVSSSVYATPLIADINSDGKLDVVVPSFVHYLEALEGSDGEKIPGWPAFHQSTVHASPLLYDIDKDGVREIALATYNGEVLFFRVSGYMMTDKLEVPRRRVKKNWYVGLDQDPVDRSHPDVNDDQLVMEATEKKSESHTAGDTHQHTPETNSSISTSTKNSHPANASIETEKKMSENQTETIIKLSSQVYNSSVGAGSNGTDNAQNGINNTQNGTITVEKETNSAENGTNTGRRLLEDDNSKGSHEGGSESKENDHENGPTLGDVDGDGHTDVVVPTLSGNIYVLSGKDGSIVRPYPYRTHGRVMNQVLLLDLSKRGEKNKGLTLVTTSFDGYLYLIDGPTSCADVVDIGETSYSMVLADNVDGGDDLDLIVSTMNGNVFCFSTPVPHHPLKAWRSTNQGRNNVANRYNREGLYITPSSRSFRDEEGKNFWVEFEIVDKYRMPSGSQAPYNVTTTLLVPGNYQGERQIKQNQIFDRPGKYRIKLPTVGVRTTGTVLVEMVDKNGLYFSDDFSLTFHMHYYKLLKWLLVLPMLGMFGVLVILRPQEAVPLPSFSRNTDL